MKNLKESGQNYFGIFLSSKQTSPSINQFPNKHAYPNYPLIALNEWPQKTKSPILWPIPGSIPSTAGFEPIDMMLQFISHKTCWICFNGANCLIETVFALASSSGLTVKL